MDAMTLALAKKYTRETVEGMGAIEGKPGPEGPPGKGVPAGGDAGQLLAKASGMDYDTHWVDPPEGGGGVTQEELEAALSGKQDKLSAGDGVAIEGSELSVTTPVRGILSQAEFDALPEEERNKGLYVISELLELPPQGPAGPDGNPIGTVISYMGLTAPENYLACDGAEYNIAAYAKLAEFFKQQFGASNYFGGDGTTTFAVPDLRNLFLRGYHGAAEEQLSGEPGIKQDATKLPYVYSGSPGITIASAVDAFSSPENADEEIPTTGGRKYSSGNTWVKDSFDTPHLYTSRPVNAAVLYCIKAEESIAAENLYSTEETRIGTWIDGKPLYRKTYAFNDVVIVKGNNNAGSISGLNVDTLVKLVGVLHNSKFTNSWQYIPNTYFSSGLTPDKSEMIVNSTNGDACTLDMLTIEYTKTTDQGVSV